MEFAKGVGTIAAVILSAFALIHTISFDRQGHKCIFLYEKNDRLIQLRNQFFEVEVILDSLNTEMIEMSIETGVRKERDSSEEKVEDLIARVTHAHIDAVRDIHTLISVWQKTKMEYN